MSRNSTPRSLQQVLAKGVQAVTLSILQVIHLK